MEMDKDRVWMEVDWEWMKVAAQVKVKLEWGNKEEERKKEKENRKRKKSTLIVPPSLISDVRFSTLSPSILTDQQIRDNCIEHLKTAATKAADQPFFVACG